MLDSGPEAKVDTRTEIVCFTVDQQEYCIDISNVLEIRGWASTTSLPHSPDFVIGMMNLRGTVLPVLDLSLRFGFHQTVPGERHVIIISQIGDKTIGLLVDAVSDIITVNEIDMQPTPNVSSSITQAFIKGVHTVGDKLVRAIEVNEILPNDVKVSG